MEDQEYGGPQQGLIRRVEALETRPGFPLASPRRATLQARRPFSLGFFESIRSLDPFRGSSTVGYPIIAIRPWLFSVFCLHCFLYSIADFLYHIDFLFSS